MQTALLHLPSTEQFRRAIATNALAALSPSARESVHRTYGLIVRVNYHFDEMAHVERTGGAGGAWAAVRSERTKVRGFLRESIPRVIDQLERALGRPSDETAVAWHQQTENMFTR